MLYKILGLSACFLLSASAFADTADDCIADFEAAKKVYDTSSANSRLNCVRQKPLFNYFAYASAPANCHGEDEWQLEARAVKGKAKKGKCRVFLRGSPGEGCGTEEIVRELDVNEFGKWQGFLTKECATSR